MTAAMNNVWKKVKEERKLCAAVSRIERKKNQ